LLRLTAHSDRSVRRSPSPPARPPRPSPLRGFIPLLPVAGATPRSLAPVTVVDPTRVDEDGCVEIVMNFGQGPGWAVADPWMGLRRGAWQPFGVTA